MEGFASDYEYSTMKPYFKDVIKTWIFGTVQGGYHFQINRKTEYVEIRNIADENIRSMPFEEFFSWLEEKGQGTMGNYQSFTFLKNGKVYLKDLNAPI